jgi:hypothetical protein
MAMPEIYQRYLGALDWYVMNIRHERVADLRYAAAVLLLRYRAWPEARGRLTQVTDLYCSTKPDLGFRAYDALLTTYFIDYGIKDEEQKDCALGRLLSIADQFTQSPCAKSPKGAEYVARIGQIKSTVKSTVITTRLQLAIENEEKGTDRQLTQCREGGGIAIVTGVAAPGPVKPGQAPEGKKLTTELDVGLALDLIDLVNQDPKDQDAAKNLNNACVIYEKVYQFGEATKCYERIARDYPASGEGMDAVWNAARNHERFFEFEQAVQGYLKVATEARFANHEHRNKALGLAAVLLDNDQQYAKAAPMFKRYSDAVAANAKDAAQAHFQSCSAHEKGKDVRSQQKCLRDLIARFGSQADAGEYVVESYLKLAAVAEKSGDKTATVRAYQKVRDEFIARRLPPATPAAAAAAKAEYLLLDDRFAAFRSRALRFSDPKKVQKTFDAFAAEAKTLFEDYGRILEYKDATWSLASLLRRGDIYYEFAQKLIKAADSPPDDIKKLERQACRLNPDDCNTVLTTYKDAIFQFVTPVEDKAKEQWRSTLDRAASLNVTNDHVKKARENLSRYLPDEFPFIKDERPQIEVP